MSTRDSRYVRVIAKDPTYFGAGNRYEICEGNFILEISKEGFEEMKNSGQIYEATSEWPVTIWYFNEEK